MYLQLFEINLKFLINLLIYLTYQLVCIYLCQQMKDTRKLILDKNFEAVRLHGFQGTRADKVIKDLGITKGALYHYFPSKKDLGYAIVDEIVAPMFLEKWQQVEACEGNPVDCIIALIEKMKTHGSCEAINLGCPLNNLMQEMSPLDDGFRIRLERIVLKIHHIIQNGLEKGQKNGYVKAEVEPAQTAIFIFSSLEGAYGIAKVMQSKEVFEQAANGLITYLRSLKNE